MTYVKMFCTLWCVRQIWWTASPELCRLDGRAGIGCARGARWGPPALPPWDLKGACLSLFFPVSWYFPLSSWVTSSSSPFLPFPVLSQCYSALEVTENPIFLRSRGPRYIWLNSPVSWLDTNYIFAKFSFLPSISLPWTCDILTICSSICCHDCFICMDLLSST